MKESNKTRADGKYPGAAASEEVSNDKKQQVQDKRNLNNNPRNTDDDTSGEAGAGKWSIDDQSRIVNIKATGRYG